jgi:hypothetical protein
MASARQGAEGLKKAGLDHVYGDYVFVECVSVMREFKATD